MERTYSLEKNKAEDLNYEAWMKKIEKDLNSSQYRFATVDAPAVVGLAGPGSGKTRALVYRTAHLIQNGIKPEQILLVTFTNKAAEVMKNRLKKLLGFYPEGIWAGTFHSVGARILRSHAHHFDRTGNFTIIDEDDRNVLMKSVIEGIKKTLSADEQKLFIKRGFAGKAISQSRNSGLGIEEIIEDYYPQLIQYTSLITKVADEYEQKKIESNSFDFDDLLVKWLELFTEHDEIHKRYINLFQHVLVDEFQDTNVVQGRIIDILAASLKTCVVGDDAQSIYAFRFAEVDNIVRFPNRHPQCEIVRMEENYRSTPQIVALINDVIALNQNQLSKNLKSLKPSGEKPWVIKSSDVNEEATFIVQRIQELYAMGIPLRDIAVLYRSSYLTQDLELEILRRGITYRTYGGLKFMQKAHIKDILSWLRILFNPNDEASWRRVINIHPGLGNASCKQVLTQISRSESPLKDVVAGTIKPSRGKEGWETIKETIEATIEKTDVEDIVNQILKSGYYDILHKEYPDSWEDRFRSLERLANYSKKYEDIRAFLEALSLEETLFHEDNTSDAERDFLTLSTIHSAKGKEWEAVFILAVNEGHFPSSWGNVNLEEERRLFYVATSRAASYLHISTYRNDYRQGSFTITGPSIFLRELSSDRYDIVYLD